MPGRCCNACWSRRRKNDSPSECQALSPHKWLNFIHHTRTITSPYNCTLFCDHVVRTRSQSAFPLGTFYQDDEQPTVNPRDTMLHSTNSMVHYRVPSWPPSSVRPRGRPRPPKPTLQTVEQARQPSPAPNSPKRTASKPISRMPQQPSLLMQTQPARKSLPKVQKKVKATPKPKSHIAKTKADATQSKTGATSQTTATTSRPARRAPPALQRFQEYLHKGKWYEVQGVADEAKWAEAVRFATGPPRAARKVVPTLVLN